MVLMFCGHKSWEPCTLTISANESLVNALHKKFEQQLASIQVDNNYTVSSVYVNKFDATVELHRDTFALTGCIIRNLTIDSQGEDEYEVKIELEFDNAVMVATKYNTINVNYHYTFDGVGIERTISGIAHNITVPKLKTDIYSVDRNLNVSRVIH